MYTNTPAFADRSEGGGAGDALPRGGSPGWVAGVGRQGGSPGLPEPGVGRQGGSLGWVAGVGRQGGDGGYPQSARPLSRMATPTPPELQV